MGSVRVAIVGVGNCASSLVQGVEYYKDADPASKVPGLMHVQFGPYHVSDVEFVAAFDVDAKKVGQDLAIHIVGVDDNFHDFHLHGHRWLDAAGDVTDNPSFGPGQSVLARFTVDNPGRWLYHCHVLAHQDGGMAGWMLVDP